MRLAPCAGLLVCLVAAAVPIAGCGRGTPTEPDRLAVPSPGQAPATPTESKQPATPAATAATTPPRDEKAEAFKAAVKKFVEEAGNVARSMDLIPDLAAYQKRVGAVEDAYSRIPDPPAGNELFAGWRKAARQVAVRFKLGTFHLTFADDAIRRTGAKGLAQDAWYQFRELGVAQKEMVQELSAAMDEGRAAKIEITSEK